VSEFFAMDCDRGHRVHVGCRALEFADCIAPLDGAEMIKLWHGMADERGGGACVPLRRRWRREARPGTSPAGGLTGDGGTTEASCHSRMK
jgi:hypothetical protein